MRHSRLYGWKRPRGLRNRIGKRNRRMGYRRNFDPTRLTALRRRRNFDPTRLTALRRRRNFDPTRLTALRRRRNFDPTRLTALRRRRNFDPTRLTALRHHRNPTFSVSGDIFFCACGGCSNEVTSEDSLCFFCQEAGCPAHSGPCLVEAFQGLRSRSRLSRAYRRNPDPNGKPWGPKLYNPLIDRGHKFKNERHYTKMIAKLRRNPW